MLTFLRLIRAPNIITSISNVCAGAFILASLQLTHPPFLNLFKLMLCSALLYATGILWNDLFDIEIDSKLRPNRPLPSGDFSINKAILLSAIFCCLCLFIAATISITTVLICLAIMISAFLYNSWAKHLSIIGALTMGLCRGLNLTLGFCVFTDFSFHHNDPFIYSILFFPLFHLAYIFLLTYIGTMQEGSITQEKILISFTLTALLILYVFLLPDALPIIVKALLALIVAGGLYRLQKILKTRLTKEVGLTVKYGLLFLIPIDALFTLIGANSFVSFLPAIIMLIVLYPISFILAKSIEMT